MEPCRSVLSPLSEQNCIKLWDAGLGLLSEQARKLGGLPRWCRGKESACFQSLGREDPLEEGVATCSSILAWEILARNPGTCLGCKELDTT